MVEAIIIFLAGIMVGAGSISLTRYMRSRRTSQPQPSPPTFPPKGKPFIYSRSDETIWEEEQEETKLAKTFLQEADAQHRELIKNKARMKGITST